MPTQYEIVDPATSTLQYEVLKAQATTQYYIQYGIDIIILFLFLFLFSKTLTWKNRVSELFKK